MAVQKCFIKNFKKRLNVKYDIREIIKHELKTPMSSNIVILNLLLMEKFGSLNDVQKEILVNIISSNASSLLVLNNYLAYEESDNLSFCETNLKELIEAAVFDLSLIFQDKKQNIIVDCDYESCFLNADKKELKRVFYNLIINLASSSNEGSKNLISIRKNKNFIEVFFVNKTYKGEFYKNKNDRFRKISDDMSFELCEKIINLHKGKLEINPFKNSIYAYKITFNTEQ